MGDLGGFPECQLPKYQLPKCQIPKMSTPKMSTPKMSTPKTMHCYLSQPVSPVHIQDICLTLVTHNPATRGKSTAQ